jgi:hypothetical protein
MPIKQRMRKIPARMPAHSMVKLSLLKDFGEQRDLLKNIAIGLYPHVENELA